MVLLNLYVHKYKGTIHLSKPGGQIKINPSTTSPPTTLHYPLCKLFHTFHYQIPFLLEKLFFCSAREQKITDFLTEYHCKWGNTDIPFLFFWFSFETNGIIECKYKGTIYKQFILSQPGGQIKPIPVLQAPPGFSDIARALLKKTF